jgi:hypothetical protein
LAERNDRTVLQRHKRVGLLRHEVQTRQLEGPHTLSKVLTDGCFILGSP